MERHEESAEDEPECPCRDRSEHRQSERRTDESKSDREEVEVRDEPERALTPDAAVALVGRNEVDRVLLDRARRVLRLRHELPFTVCAPDGCSHSGCR